MKILIDDRYTDEARRLLDVERFSSRGSSRENPVTGMGFVHGLDPIVWQIRDAARALRARARFARENPDLPPLPLNHREWGGMKSGPTAYHIEHALGLFGRSLPPKHNLDRHPSFHDYMCGFLCGRSKRERFAPIAHLFPPKPLPGLVPGYSYWGSPTRPSYLDELAQAEPTGMPEWPEGWLLPGQTWFANYLAAEGKRKASEPVKALPQ